MTQTQQRSGSPPRRAATPRTPRRPARALLASTLTAAVLVVVATATATRAMSDMQIEGELREATGEGSDAPGDATEAEDPEAAAPEGSGSGAESPLQEALEDLTGEASTAPVLIEGVIVDAVPGEVLPTEPPDPSAHAGIARYRSEELYYSLRFFGTELARGALVLGDYEAVDGAWTLPAYGLALTEGVAAMIYPLRDEASTTIDPETGLPLRAIKDLREREHYRNYDVRYDQAAYTSQITRIRDENERSRYQRALPSNTYDALSWVYALRDQPLEPGTTAVYYMYDGWKLSRITATVRSGTDSVLVGDEYVECREIALYRQVMLSERPLPFIQETAALPPVMWEQETRQGEQVGNVWISNDERRLPVKIEFENELVSAIAQLTSFRPPTSGY